MMRFGGGAELEVTRKLRGGAEIGADELYAKRVMNDTLINAVRSARRRSMWEERL